MFSLYCIKNQLDMDFKTLTQTVNLKMPVRKEGNALRHWSL